MMQLRRQIKRSQAEKDRRSESRMMVNQRQ